MSVLSAPLLGSNCTPEPERPPPPPPRYDVTCRRHCTAEATSIVGRANPLGPVNCSGPRVPFTDGPRLIDLTITTTETDTEMQLSECIASFDEATTTRHAGRTLRRVEVEMLNTNMGLQQAISDTGCGPGSLNVTCQPAGSDALVGVQPAQSSPRSDGGRLGSGLPQCSAGQHRCGNTCYPDNDPDHCPSSSSPGNCRSCDPDHACVGTRCVPTCQDFGETCDPSTHPAVAPAAG